MKVTESCLIDSSSTSNIHRLIAIGWFRSISILIDSRIHVQNRPVCSHKFYTNLSATLKFFKVASKKNSLFSLGMKCTNSSDSYCSEHVAYTKSNSRPTLFGLFRQFLFTRNASQLSWKIWRLQATTIHFLQVRISPQNYQTYSTTNFSTNQSRFLKARESSRVHDIP